MTTPAPNPTKEKRTSPQSRLGRKPVPVPEGVKVSVTGQTVLVEGKRGKLSWTVAAPIRPALEEKEIKFIPANDEPKTKALHGLSRKLVLNMVHGVTTGFQKRLVVEGVGFRANVTGSKLTLTIGFSHPYVYNIPSDIKVMVDPKVQNILIIDGNDKQRVGEIAAQIRNIKEPEPYKGTGIRYEDEIVKRKAGKAAVAGGGKK